MKTAFTAAVFALLVFFPVFVSGQPCSHGDIRLVGGSNELEGRVEVCSSGLWGTVCDRSWDYRDAGVVCRQLGHAYDGAIARLSAYFGYTSYPSVRLTSVMCSGSELRLIDCSYSNDTDTSDDYYDHCDILAEYIDYYDDHDYYFFCYIHGCCDHFPWHHYCNHYDDAGVTCLPGVTNNTVLEVDITDLDTDIESVRLVNFNSTLSNMGLLEVKYNGTWGTVCDRFWSYSDARVACGMLGFDDAACAVTTNKFGTAENSVPFLMDSVQCSGHEEALDQCTFTGWGNTVYLCSHRSNDAGVVCANTSQIGTPYNIRLVDSTTTTITINFTVPELPDVVERLRYYISYQSETSSFPSYATLSLIGSSHREGDEVSYSFTSLTRDTEYTAQIRVQVLYFVCGSTSYVSGHYSDPVTIRTNATSKRTTIPTRLVSPYPGVDFLGRVEIFYNNQWGTICDDYFSTIDANVICQALNFTDGALCAVSNARYGAGTGPIWLDDVGCRAVDEVLEDCSSRGWGIHNCRHSSDVGVVCTPNDLPPVKDVRVTSVSHTSITVAWTEHSFLRGYSSAYLQLVYKSQRVSNTLILPRTLTEYRLRGLGFEQQYNISLRARLRYRYCSAYIYGQYSNEVSITTMETAPDGPPTSFELEAINTTAIEAMWELPSINNRNGFIRGYRLFVQRVGGEAWNITIPDNTTLAYIVGGLQRNTHYTFSVLAYTVADGPKSIHLTEATLLYDPLITEFGVYGSGVDKLIRYTYNNGLQVHCTTSSDPSIVRTDWYFANGTKVGLVDTNFREGHYPHNKTTVLQIGLNRRLTYCDAGNYTCVVKTNSSRTESRSFHLLIGTSAPSPSRPTAVNIKSTSITIAWSQPLCDGGHTTKSYRIRYRRSSSYAYSYIVVSDPTQRNYTIMGLRSTTLYDFSVYYTTVDSRTSSYSLAVTVSTLPPAPSAPRDVTVRLVRPLLAEVSWREPATPNGAITHYTVYALPQLSRGPERRKRQTTTVPPNVKKSFPSTVTSGNITLSNYSISYQFQVSASTSYGQVTNEGELSPISANATIFVPEPGLPTPVDIRMSTITNTSITLSWMYPPPPVHPIESYYVTYSGEVEWRSPGGALLQFDDEGELSVTGTTAVISPLIPGIRYHFKVSAITTTGRGGEVDAFGSTQAYPGSLAHFQLRITPVFSCLELTSPSQNNIEEFRSAIVDEINDQVCPQCRLTTANIKEDQFSCRGLTNHIVYRAMLVGTGTNSAPDIVSLLQMWVASGSASISALSTRLHLDKDCNTVLDTLDDPVCPLQVVSEETTTTTQAAVSKTTIPKPDNKGPSSNPITGEHIRVGEVLGFVLGIAIIVLLGVLIVVIIIVAAKKFKSKPNKSVSHERIFSDASFSHMGPGSNKENVNLYDIDDKDK